MDERFRFVARHLDGESISSLCREFRISRLHGHKVIDQCKQCGVEAFTDCSRRPYRIANQLPFQVIEANSRHPGGGAGVIRMVGR